MSILIEIGKYSNSHSEWLLSFALAFIGAVTGGLFTLGGVNLNARINRKQAERDSLELQLSVLKGIKGEVVTLMNLYDKRMRYHLGGIGPGKFLSITFLIGDDNFTFYEQNARVIAKLSDTSRDSIISVYTYIRSLIQTFKTNNQLIVDYNRIIFDMADNNKNKELYERLRIAQEKVMVNYAQAIKEINAEVKEAVDKGIETIDQEIAALQEKLKN